MHSRPSQAFAVVTRGCQVCCRGHSTGINITTHRHGAIVPPPPSTACCVHSRYCRSNGITRHARDACNYKRQRGATTATRAKRAIFTASLFAAQAHNRIEQRCSAYYRDMPQHSCALTLVLVLFLVLVLVPGNCVRSRLRGKLRRLDVQLASKLWGTYTAVCAHNAGTLRVPLCALQRRCAVAWRTQVRELLLDSVQLLAEEAPDML